MTLAYGPATVLDTTEARSKLPALAASARDRGAESEIVYCGPHRRPDLAIVPAALFQKLAPYIEDILIAERIRERRAGYEGGGATRREIQERLGIADAEVDAAAAEILAAQS